jgi:RimJ/RimL family protein N-acetyltransferase
VGFVQCTITGGGIVADIAWVIGVPWQRRGYATEATRALVEWLAVRGVSTITAHIHPDHHASSLVAERIGMTPTGTIEEGERVWRRIGATRLEAASRRGVHSRTAGSDGEADRWGAP